MTTDIAGRVFQGFYQARRRQLICRDLPEGSTKVDALAYYEGKEQAFKEVIDWLLSS